MRKKVAVVLVFAMLNWNINILADTGNGGSDITEETGGAAVETQNTIQTGNEGTQEKQEDAGQTDTKPPREEGTEESAKAPEDSETPESIETSESAETPESTETPESIETSESAEIPGSTEISESTEALESTEVSESTEIPDDTKASQEGNTESPKADTGDEKPEELLWNGHEKEELQSARAEDVVYKVLFPANTNAYLDPGNISGKGQIFSDRYEVENYGNTDVAIKIKNIEISYPSTEEKYKFTDEEFAKDNEVNNIHVDMVWENEDGTSQIINLTEGTRNEYVLELKAAEYDGDELLSGPSEGGTGWFYFTGSMDPDLELDWEDEKITVSFYYAIVSPESINTLSQDTPDEENAKNKDKEMAVQETAGNHELWADDVKEESSDCAEDEREKEITEDLPKEKEEETEESMEKEENFENRQETDHDEKNAKRTGD